MTLATTTPLIEYIENGATLTHAVPFQFQQVTEVVVSRIDPVTQVETVLLRGSDYNVTGGAGNTGTVTKTSAGTVGTILRIRRLTTRAQWLDLITGDTLPAQVLENAFDRLAAVDEEQDVDIADLRSRALRVPPGEIEAELPRKSSRVGTLLGFNDATGVRELLSYSAAAGKLFAPMKSLFGGIAKGDPGGNAMAIGLAIAVAGMSLASGAAVGFDQFRTTGYNSADDNGQGWYRRMAAIEAVTVGELTSADGVRLGLHKNQPRSPEMFGATGTGADDYPAFIKLAAFTNAAGGGVLSFRAGATYFMGQHRTLANALPEVIFSGCNGLFIDGNGATISVDGNFLRDAKTTWQISGLYLQACNGVSVRNLTMLGNVNLMTRAGDVMATTMNSGSPVVTVVSTAQLVAGNLAIGTGIPSGTIVLSIDSATQLTLSKNATVTATNSVNYKFNEGPSHGVKIMGGEGLYLEKVTARLFASDGFYVGENTLTSNPVEPTRKLTMIGCKSEYNARQALSIIQLRGGLFLNSDFNNSGMADGVFGGTYGFHSPGAGCDVEPNKHTGTASPNQMSINTGALRFLECRFIGNRGSAFTTTADQSADKVSVLYCHMICPVVADVTTGVIFGIVDGVMEHCTLDLADRRLWLGYTAPDATLTVRHNKGTFSGIAFLTCYSTVSLDLSDNEWTGQHTAPMTSYAWLATNPAMRAARDKWFLPAAAYADPGSGDGQIVMFGGQGTFRDISFATDLAAAAGSEGKAHFANAFNTAAKVYDGSYAGAAPGTADTWRPAVSSTFDTTGPHNKNHANANAIGAITIADAALAFSAGITPATVIYSAPITAARTVTLGTTAGFIFKGARCRVIRKATCTGAFNLSVAGATTKALAANAADQAVLFECLDGATWTHVDTAVL